MTDNGERLAERKRSALQASIDRHGLSLAQLARKAGLPSATLLYNFRNGHSNSLSDATVLKILGALPYSTLEELMGCSLRPQPLAELSALKPSASVDHHRDQEIAALRRENEALRDEIQELRSLVGKKSLEIERLQRAIPHQQTKLGAAHLAAPHQPEVPH